MSYVLVSLVAEGDAATQASDAFAQWYAEQHAPVARFHGEQPDHAEITAAVVAIDPRRGFVLGHGGETLRAEPGAGPLEFFRAVRVWADCYRFAEMFRGARVYVFACSTLAREEGTESFGRNAVELGVAAYAGHWKPIHAPEIAGGDLHDERLRRVIARVVRRFLDGCDSLEALLMEARSAASRGAKIQLRPIPEAFNDAAFPLDWSLDWQRILGSLKVELPR